MPNESVFGRMEDSFKELGVGFGDVIKMTVFLVGDPEMDGRMDFGGFMKAYTKYFGTEEQPNKPARSAVQIAGSRTSRRDRRYRLPVSRAVPTCWSRSKSLSQDLN
jgi:enamine deaminase RidA (YjgF/YER057c/UK114 family)